MANSAIKLPAPDIALIESLVATEVAAELSAEVVAAIAALLNVTAAAIPAASIPTVFTAAGPLLAISPTSFIDIPVGFVPSIFIFTGTVDGTHDSTWVCNFHGSNTAEPGFDFASGDHMRVDEFRVELSFAVPTGTTDVRLFTRVPGFFSGWSFTGWTALKIGAGP